MCASYMRNKPSAHLAPSTLAKRFKRQMGPARAPSLRGPCDICAPLLLSPFLTLFSLFQVVHGFQDLYNYPCELNSKIGGVFLLKFEIQDRSRYLKIWIRRNYYFINILIILVILIKFRIKLMYLIIFYLIFS